MSYMVYAYLDQEILALESREFFDEATKVADQMIEEIFGDESHDWYASKEYVDESGIKVEIISLS